MATKKQKLFIEYYLKHNNASKAARLAGYSERSAGAIGSKLLTKVEIQEIIQQRYDEAKMSADVVLRELAAMAEGVNLLDYVEVKEKERQGKGETTYTDIWMSFDLDRFNEDGYGPLVKRIKQTATGLDIELYDRKGALELVGKHHALFTEKIEQTNKGTIKVKISE